MNTKKVAKSLCELKETEKYENTLPSLDMIKKSGPAKAMQAEKKNSINP